MALPDESMQRNFLEGFIKDAYSYNYDVCVFTMYQKFHNSTEKRNIGESNIFELINYDLFDGIVILSETILIPGFIEPLHKRIKEVYDKPVLVVDKESLFFDSVMMDHYSPMKKIVDHLIEHHGYKDIAYIGGKEGHPHSIQRCNAFVDSMNEHNIPVRSKWVYHGNFWYDSAEKFADILLKDRKHLPRAIVCANDIMAIGIASMFAENGIRIPEDVAITGYDSIEAGRTSPSPLTSADAPFRECGEYCIRRIHNAINGKMIGDFKSDAPFFTGGSCGCKHEIEMVPKTLRSAWKTPNSSGSLFSDFDHMIEDLMSKKNIVDFLKVIDRYSHQVKPFASLDFCFNEELLYDDPFAGDKVNVTGYSDVVCNALSFEGDRSFIDFGHKFDTSKITPRLYEERPYPTTFFFNPIFSEDRCFGYTVLSYGEDIQIYDQRFRIWMRDVMQGLEAFYRQRYMLALIERMKLDQIRDSLTGLYNYDGFLKDAKEIFFDDTSDKVVSIIAMDIKNMHQINEVYGHNAGERAIKIVAQFLSNSLNENEISCRMFNDEFIVGLYDDEALTRSTEIVEDINDRLTKYHLIVNSDYALGVHYSILTGTPSEIDELEILVNQSVSIKNHKKIKSRAGNTGETAVIMDEIKRNQVVNNILNKNLLTYHYQPIVNVKDGSIYAYEALMRCEVENISPYNIISSATYLNRLSDIEKYTLLNVTSDVEENLDNFGDAKVFINSLPGIQLSDSDEKEFAQRVMENEGRFVIEYTEESQLDDSLLQIIKNKYNRYGCSTAIDDYGTGYSNVNNLLRYAPQYVKIDRSLITDIQLNPQKQHLVRSMINFAHNNDILILAEGVETEAELSECIRLGVDLIQGYYTGRPQRDPIGEIDPEIIKQIRQARMKDEIWGSF